jgi:hypothetical protein
VQIKLQQERHILQLSSPSQTKSCINRCEMRQTPAAPALRGSDVETEQDTQIFSGVPQMTLTRFRGFLVGGSCHKIQGLKQVSVTGDLSPDYGHRMMPE